VLRIDGDGLVPVGLPVDDLVPPDVAALRHCRAALDGVPEPSCDEDVLDRRAGLECLVDGRLEGGRLAAPPTAVGGDDELRLAVLDSSR
jgi:hypothetical protein